MMMNTEKKEKALKVFQRFHGNSHLIGEEGGEGDDDDEYGDEDYDDEEGDDDDGEGLGKRGRDDDNDDYDDEDDEDAAPPSKRQK